MIHTLENGDLTVQISGMGAELQSVRSKDGTEYIWDGSHESLRLRAPLLFPFVSRLYESSYKIEGKTYEMPFLGFCYDREFVLKEAGSTYAVYVLRSSEETKRYYPFEFVLEMGYLLDGTELKVSIDVYNRDQKTMYFSLGWHPTLRVPLENGLCFDDYSYVFDRPARPLKIEREDGKYLGAFQPFPLEEDIRLPFRDSWMDEQGVIVLRDVAKSFTLSSEKGRHGVTVSYPDMRLLVLMHKRGVPYITAEAWTSFMGRKGIVEELSGQPDLVPLSPGGFYRNTWSLKFF